MRNKRRMSFWREPDDDCDVSEQMERVCDSERGILSQCTDILHTLAEEIENTGMLSRNSVARAQMACIEALNSHEIDRVGEEKVTALLARLNSIFPQESGVQTNDYVI